MTQTNKPAAEWVIDQIRSLANNSETHLGMGDIKVTQKYLDNLLEKAREINREQIIKSFLDGLEWPEVSKNEGKVSANFYYRDTYGG